MTDYIKRLDLLKKILHRRIECSFVTYKVWGNGMPYIDQHYVGYNNPRPKWIRSMNKQLQAQMENWKKTKSL